MRPEFHILLIEDSPTDVLIIERALREAAVEHRLTVVGEGRQALATLIATARPDSTAAQRPDLILLDLNLPDRPGMEVLAALRSDPRTSQVPVVVVSADATPGQVDRLLDAGATDYLTKPFDVSRFLGLVDELLANGERRTPDDRP